MNSSVTTGQYLAVPFRPFGGDPSKNDQIFDGLLRLPIFPVGGMTEHEKRTAIALELTNPNHLAWEAWHHDQLVGIFLVTRIVRGLDALAHFAFFDRQLLGRRRLVLHMMGWCFRELALQRLSVEIPDTLDPLIRFCRTKLGFKYEGEHDAAAHPMVDRLREFRINGQAQWVSKWGSRREHMHWDNGWHDVVVLRILREEYDAFMKEHA